MIRESIQKLVEGISLSNDEARESLREIMSGNATSAQIAAFLTALRMKIETVDELVAFATVMRENCLRIHPHVSGRLVDTCGTGGDRVKTFNVSTAAAFVSAGAGISVAKHGNRSVTSKSGSADVLEKLGVNLCATPQNVEAMIERVGIGFMFAPVFHPAMKYAAAPRKEIGVRTVFNVLGPLTNPACADAQLLGVYESKLTIRLANALRVLGCEEAMVVHGLDGLDEISTLGKTVVSHLKNGEVSTCEISPEDFGVKKSKAEDLRGGTSDENAELLFQILNGENQVGSAKEDLVLVNSAAAIVLGGNAESLKEGSEKARSSIECGAAYKKLKMLVVESGGDKSILEGLEQKYA